jgi:hypothetical protein
MLQLAQTECELIDEVPKIRLEREPQHKIVWLEPDEEQRLLNDARGEPPTPTWRGYFARTSLVSRCCR